METDMYEWLLFGHLVGVVLFIAGFAVYVVGIDRGPRAKTLAELRLLAALSALGERIFIGGGLCLITFGVTLAAKFWSFSDGWILSAIALVVAQGAGGAAVVGPRVRRLHEALSQAPAAQSEVPIAISTLSRDRVMRAAARVSIVSLAEIVFLMTVKPAGEILFLSLLVAVFAGAALGARVFAQRSHPLLSTKSSPTGEIRDQSDG